MWQGIELVPGLNVELTPAALRSGYSAMDMGRWKSGKFQKLGGWTRYYPLNLGGTPYALHAWEDLAKNQRVMAGTSTGIFDITNGALTDITPQTLVTTPAVSVTTTAGSTTVTITDASISTVTTSDSVLISTPIAIDGIVLAGLYQITAYISSTSYTITSAAAAVAGVTAGGAVPTFSTTAGSAGVTITLTAHGLYAGASIVLPIATTAGGITIQGRYAVAKVIDANNVIVLSSVAAATTTGSPVPMNGGLAGYTYYLTKDPTQAGGTYGTGNYGDGDYGTGTLATGQAGTNITATGWTLDNYGELAIACPENGGIYFWGPASGFGNAQVIGNAPAYSAGAFVSVSQETIIAYGSSVDAVIGTYQDPLEIRWCDPSDITTWQGTITNQAGRLRVSQGSRIVGGGATPTVDLIWTDIDLWEMTYIGSSLVYSLTKLGEQCGLIAKHAWTSLGGAVYWMSPAGFFRLAGGVAKLECPVWDAVFQNLDSTAVSKVHAGSNSMFGEVEFYYPSASGGAGICDRRVTYNSDNGLWSMATLQRNAWIDVSGAGAPISVSNTGALYQHETSADAAGAPINSWFETGWIYISEGEDIAFVDRFIPDFRWGEYGGSQNANIQITFSVCRNLSDIPSVYGPFTVTQATRYISKRFRGRHLKLRVESNDTGSFWRLGHCRMRVAADGSN